MTGRVEAQSKLTQFGKEHISKTMRLGTKNIPTIEKQGQEKHPSEGKWVLEIHTEPNPQISQK